MKLSLNLPAARAALARAAAKDAADRHMRSQQRTRWNDVDYMIAVRVFNQLCPDDPVTPEPERAR